MDPIQAILFAAVMSILVGRTASGYEISFPSFDLNRDMDNFIMLGDSGISTGAVNALQVTSGTGNPKYSIKNSFGRALLRKKFRLYRGGNTVSFSTAFVFNIQPMGSGGEGLAFTITSSDYMPNDSYGQWLGLFNASTNGRNSGKVLAVEFDTRESPGTNDPDGNHVGINVNDINSENFLSLDQDKINLKGGYDIRAWILYDGKRKKLDVYVANESDPMPPKPVVSSIIDLCSGVLEEEAYFGFSASTGEATEFNCVLSWNFTISDSAASEKHWTLDIVIPVICLFIVMVMVTEIVVLLKCRRKSRVEASVISGALQNIPGRPREFRYKDLRKATNNFSAEAELGRGGSGTVYKGILPKEKTVVAVKCMAKDSKGGKEEFISEISIINRLRQKNLVPLLGWCHEKGHLIMVYEYMPNGSLNKHIFNLDNAGVFLDWDQRYNIVSGVASALLYLHEECEQQVIHRDVKASNIMLDSDYNARLGDFGLARLIEHNRRSMSLLGVAGTVGYIAPECLYTERATAEADVFSFGAVILEVVCGRPPRSRGRETAPDLVTWVWELYGQDRLLEAVDSCLPIAGNANVNEDGIRLLLMLGLACSHSNPQDRPTMREVTQILARTMPPPYVPPLRPPFVWPHLPSELISSSTSLINTNNVLYSDKSFIHSYSPDGNGTSNQLCSDNSFLHSDSLYGNGTSKVLGSHNSFLHSDSPDGNSKNNVLSSDNSFLHSDSQDGNRNRRSFTGDVEDS